MLKECTALVKNAKHGANMLAKNDITYYSGFSQTEPHCTALVSVLGGVPLACLPVSGPFFNSISIGLHCLGILEDLCLPLFGPVTAAYTTVTTTVS